MAQSDSRGRELYNRLRRILKDPGIIPPGELIQILNAGLYSVTSPAPEIRPLDERGVPGGLVELPQAEYRIIVPDLHGRMDFLLKVLRHRPPGDYPARGPVLSDVLAGRAQIICVGDAFHSESRGRQRWQQAMEEFIDGFKRHGAMDQEMRENLGLLAMICILQDAAPTGFFFLKGNHENIANEEGEGNHPFRKFVYEGDMVKRWVQQFMGEEIFRMIYEWEKALPLMTRAEDFLVTHAEPARVLSEDDVVNAYLRPGVIHSLTWVDNGQAEEYSAEGTLSNLLGSRDGGRIFGGHRPVSGRYDLRQQGRYVQINTPNRHVVAYVDDMKNFLPEQNIYEIQD